MIDFAQCVSANEPLPLNTTYPPVHLNRPDVGYLRGLSSLIFYFKLMFEQFCGVEYRSFDEATAVMTDLHSKGKLDTGCRWLDEFENDTLPSPYSFNFVPDYEVDHEYYDVSE
ncbi:unnamed protein product [Ambrosiozyma monospora]|uniref:Unnamed protein product n=1 Tax=Ambrosiozyma monospora TaxID=43982 RepID=A0ACB5U4H8_AMBMO|nr:unnamed protein product [Ambrosiozyma monospora]